ncbi:hypothetical protein L1987_07575 [Smallanthus sonchifolius]|uniref:Uncharacterized protein n=1 Tax=Smallanthus sonchifolius TaxID=185202 RepID=A0ACB9K0M8_9ASTR|nr:hypothetical protein L1987_07575 [Smallanthus sonchifolius]
MRSDVLPIDKDAIQTFSNWLLDVGDGRVEVLDKEGQIDVKRIEIPPEFVLEYTETALAELIHAMYQAMEAKRIASLKLRADGLPIEVCVLRNPAVNVVSHSVHLRIGTATAVDSIPDTDVLPHHYFELCDYEKFDTLRGDSHQLIDFIGLLQGMEEKTTKDHNPFLNLTLTNESFKSDSGSNQQTKLQQMAGKKTLAALEENTVTIAELLQKQQQELAGKTFICIASITEITGKKWCYNACPKCLQTIHESGDEWACADDGKFKEPKYMYRIVATIADETGNSRRLSSLLSVSSTAAHNPPIVQWLLAEAFHRSSQTRRSSIKDASCVTNPI